MKAFPTSSIMEDGYSNLERIEEGTYGVVYKAVERRTKKMVAMKKLKLENEREGFPLTSLREIIAMTSLTASARSGTGSCPNIVPIREVVIGEKDNSVYIVMDYLDNDMSHLLSRNGRFTLPFVKLYLEQLLKGIDGMHQRSFIHRDLKTSNLLIKGSLLQIADFGLTRKFLSSSTVALTPVVQTLWYRAPEILLGQPDYDEKVDLWSIGLIMAEMISGTPIIREETEIAQLTSILSLLGRPKDCTFLKNNTSRIPERFTTIDSCSIRKNIKAAIPHINDLSMDLLLKFLEFDPAKRCSAKEALRHPFFCGDGDNDNGSSGGYNRNRTTRTTSFRQNYNDPDEHCIHNRERMQSYYSRHRRDNNLNGDDPRHRGDNYRHIGDHRGDNRHVRDRDDYNRMDTRDRRDYNRVRDDQRRPHHSSQRRDHGDRRGN